MSRLQQLIIQLGGATLSEVNKAIFTHPELGLLESLARTIGDDRAEKLRMKIAETVGVPLIPDAQVNIDESVLNVSAVQLTPLVGHHKALPLRRVQDSGAQQLLLAMSDPLDQQAKNAFQKLFQIPVKVALARERAISNAFAVASAKLSLAARAELQDRPESIVHSMSRFVEDPELTKALQQVIATAVKHHVLEVSIDLTAPFTRAVFRFPDGHTSSVDVSVSPVAFAAAVVRRAQIAGESSQRVNGRGRVRFKSVTVDFGFTGDLGSRGPAGEAGTPARLELQGFNLDGTDNPVFWAGIDGDGSAALHSLLAPTNGVVVVASAGQASREFALRAISESYPDAKMVDGVAAFNRSSDLLKSARAQRVVVGVDRGDLFQLWELLMGQPKEQREVIRGLFCYSQVPRSCCFCKSEPRPVAPDVLELPERYGVTLEGERCSVGCTVCEKQGYLGFYGIASVLECSGVVKEQLLAGKPLSGVIRESKTGPMFVQALRAVQRGLITMEVVREAIAEPPPDYLLSLQVDEDLALHAEDDPIPERPMVPRMLEPRPTLRQSGSLHGAPRVAAEKPAMERYLMDEPIRGRDAFLVGGSSGSKNSVVHEDDLAIAPDEELAPAMARKRSGDERSLLLVIDDDPDQRSILRRVFELAGYRVEVAADGIDGIVSAARLEPQLIIVDFMMPELDGRETIRRLKNGPTTGGIPVVALTAYADPDVELGLLQAGADDFCAKSVSKQVLLKRVERLLKMGAVE